MFSKFFKGISVFLLLSAQTVYSNSLVPYSGTPGVHAVYRGIWAVFDNPAGIAEIKAFNTGAYYQSQFLMPELSAQSFALVLPLKRAGNLGLGYHQFGYDLYKEQGACFTFARSFGSSVSAAVRFDYRSAAFGLDYGSSNAFTGSAGVIARISGPVRVGAAIFNPQRLKFSNDREERYPSVMMAGISWNFGGETELAVGISKPGNGQHTLQCALRYEVSAKFLLHGSVSDGSDAFLFGYAFTLGKLEIGMTSGYHHHLGFSPRFSLTFKNR